MVGITLQGTDVDGDNLTYSIVPGHDGDMFEVHTYDVLSGGESETEYVKVTSVKFKWGVFADYEQDQNLQFIFILFPDPWRKKRHKNRRIIQKNILDQFYRLLKIGGEFRSATDDPLYLRWILLHLKDHCQQ